MPCNCMNCLQNTKNIIFLIIIQFVTLVQRNQGLTVNIYLHAKLSFGSLFEVILHKQETFAHFEFFQRNQIVPNTYGEVRYSFMACIPIVSALIQSKIVFNTILNSNITSGEMSYFGQYLKKKKNRCIFPPLW